MKFLKYVLDLIYPKRCIFCNEVVEKDVVVCDKCEKALPEFRNHYPQFTRYGKIKCVSPFKYLGPPKTAIWVFKFRYAKNNAKFLAQYMIKTIKRHYSNIKFDYIAYVPSNRNKKRVLGYIPVEELYKEIAPEFGLFEEKPIILKIKKTKEQKKATYWERLKNLKGAFAVSKDFDLKFKTILLIDDIKTTGLTIDTTAKVLYESGAKQVYAAVFAMVENQKQKPEGSCS